jgi:hypothetical protein
VSELLSISNFAGIEKIDLEFKKLNVFIGPQASGKSITIKLAYFFKEMFSDLPNSIAKNEYLNTFKSDQVDKFMKFFPKKSWKNGDFTITYKIRDGIFICIKRSGDTKPKIDFSSELLLLINKMRRMCRGLNKDYDNHKKIPFTRRMEIENKLSKEFFKHVNGSEMLFNGTQFFIPAGRSFFSNLQESIFTFLKDNTVLDPFLIEFGSNYEMFKNFFYSQVELSNDIEGIIGSVLNSKYKREKNIDSLVHKDSRIVNLSNASSGQQEILPLLIILKILIEDNIKLNENEKSAIYIEEPEAHLFPTAQKAIVRLLAILCNMGEYQIFITTHSPYLLSSINNHFVAGSIESDKSEEVYKIIRKEEILYAYDSKAYSLKDGKCESLISEEDGLILAEVLDDVSNDIASDFDHLLDLKYGA